MENKPTPFYSDEDYIKANSLQCKLILQHAENRVFILILDRDQNLRYLTDTPVESFLSDTYFFDNLKFERAELLTIPETFAFMPFELDDEKGQHNYDSLLLSDEQEHILHEKMFHHEIDNKFTVRDTAYALQKKMGGIRIIPSSNVLIKCLADVSKPMQAAFGIHFYEQEFEITLFDNQKFTFYNRFPMAHAADFNYFLLAVLEQFNIPTGAATFYLSGEILEDYEAYRRIQKYSKDIHFLTPDIPFRLPNTIDNPHRYSLLTTLALCASLEEH